jgi:hypothetical protein
MAMGNLTIQKCSSSDGLNGKFHHLFSEMEKPDNSHLVACKLTMPFVVHEHLEAGAEGTVDSWSTGIMRASEQSSSRSSISDLIWGSVSQRLSIDQAQSFPACLDFRFADSAVTCL